VAYEDWLLKYTPSGAKDDFRLRQATSAPVQVYLHNQDYFGRLLQLIRRLKQGDEIILAGWGFNRSQRLDDSSRTCPPLPRYANQTGPKATPITADQQTSLEYVLQRAIVAQQATVRLMVTDNNGYEATNNAEIVDALNQIKPGTAIMDTQVLASQSHHQKCVYIKCAAESGGPFFFVGGMDVLAGGRNTWLDLQVEISGPAAELGLQSMNERWASAANRSDYKGVPTSGAGSGTTLQFVRIYGGGSKIASNPGPQGERKYNDDASYAQLLQAAIAKAQKYIYIEDQFFTATDGMDDLLLAAGNRNCFVIVVSVDKSVCFDPARRDSLVNKLRSSANKSNFQLFQVKQPDNPKVHTKVWLFDDKLAVVGSAGYYQFSLAPAFFGGSSTLNVESEIGVAIASNAPGGLYTQYEFVKDLRFRLWSRLCPARYEDANGVLVEEFARLAGRIPIGNATPTIVKALP
jgi:hypothetical protein